ncbi:hypothetical protein BRADI_3g57705v3 [Brachypodium distachyon]|uniref:Uncharacterized protein n=1 Tax=Brachypodium distachyon TaxID=15368 RepID=A0A2K2D5K3_BRADI|nr:hypothetical protein BRADI_3g57705v3 [Brachypodium distachyon]
MNKTTLPKNCNDARKTLEQQYHLIAALLLQQLSFLHKLSNLRSITMAKKQQRHQKSRIDFLRSKYSWVGR